MTRPGCSMATMIVVDLIVDCFVVSLYAIVEVYLCLEISRPKTRLHFFLLSCVSVFFSGRLDKGKIVMRLYS